MFVQFTRILKFAFQSFFRNFWLSVANVTILSLTLIVINFLIVFNLLTMNAIDIVKDKVDVSLYFKQNIAIADIEQVKQKISQSPDIKSVEYISSEQALAIFQDRHKGDVDISKTIEDLKKEDGQIFNSSLKIKAKDIAMYDKILSELKSNQYSNLFDIDENQFRDYTKITERLNNISAKVELVGYIVSLIFIIITLTMVYNSIKIAIYTHRDEIYIMKLVGANTSFIKGPFFIEILMSNIIALLVVMGIVYGLSAIIQPFIDKLFEGYSVNIIAHFNENFVLIFFGQFLVSSIFSVSSSYIAMKKYLK